MSWIAISSALWLGIITAISPCPLASNIAAISFIGRQVGNRRGVLLSGLFYAIGRTISYVLLGFIITAGFLASDEVARFLQKYMNEILGPFLILLGMILLGLIGSTLSLNLASDGVQRRAAKGGIVWSLLLGVLFALSFCPVSAGLFFAGLIPLSVKEGSRFLLPVFYGIGTALPVIAFAFLIAFASEYVGKAFDRLTQIEKWIRITAGVLFILVGAYYCLIHVYGISLY
ncbi:MAG: sulfite exporter TauE/SafE family protein [Kiritimatiellae bacterium]|nr:sulfite exporter TauE/SafE family protein [Kiritimatiellia bacterium]